MFKFAYELNLCSIIYLFDVCEVVTCSCCLYTSCLDVPLEGKILYFDDLIRGQGVCVVDPVVCV